MCIGILELLASVVCGFASHVPKREYLYGARPPKQSAGKYIVPGPAISS